MITLIDDAGYPVAIATTGKHTPEECLRILMQQNDSMEHWGLGRFYKEAVNQDGVRVNENPI